MVFTDENSQCMLVSINFKKNLVLSYISIYCISYVLKNQFCSVLKLEVDTSQIQRRLHHPCGQKRKILKQNQHSKKLRMFGSKLGLSQNTSLKISYNLPRNKKT